MNNLTALRFTIVYEDGAVYNLPPASFCSEHSQGVDEDNEYNVPKFDLNARRNLPYIRGLTI